MVVAIDATTEAVSRSACADSAAGATEATAMAMAIDAATEAVSRSACADSAAGATEATVMAMAIDAATEAVMATADPSELGSLCKPRDQEQRRWLT